MKRMSATALAMGLALSAFGTTQDKTELRYSLKKGEKLSYSLQHNISVKLDKVPEILQGVVPEDPIAVKFEGTVELEVTEVAADGAALLNGKWRTAKAKGHIMVNDIDFDYDAAKAGNEKPKKPDAEDPALAGFGDLQDQLGKMVRTPLKLSVDRLGKVSVVEGAGKLGEIESVFRSLNGLMGPLPKAAVAKGDTWKDELKLGMPGVGGNVDIKIRTQNTIEAVDKVNGEDCLVIKSKFSVGGKPGEKDEPQPNVEVKIKTEGEGEGKTWFSLAQNRSIKSASALKVKVTANIPNPGGGDEMELKAVLKIDSSHEFGK